MPAYTLSALLAGQTQCLGDCTEPRIQQLEKLEPVLKLMLFEEEGKCPRLSVLLPFQFY